MQFINDLNLKKQADELGIKVWQTPGFIFLLMGLVTIAIMTATYFISKKYDDPRVVVVSECIVVSLILILGTSVVRIVDRVMKLNKTKTEFVSVASHQLRTPLSAIRWETELLMTKFREGLNEKQLKNVENIFLLSGRMTKLVNDLLDVARIDQNRFILKKNKIALAKIIEETVEEKSLLFKPRHIEVVLNLGKDLPEVLGDQEKIKLALENLVDNAFKYTTSGGKIEINLLKDENNVVFEIKDNGVGIPEEQTGRIFEKFFRSNNAVKYQTEGTGLGLYIAKNVIDQMGGKIWFKSIENVGSIFSFSLPIDNEK